MHENNFTKKNLNIYIKEFKHWLKVNETKLKKLKFNLVPLKYYIFKLYIKYFLRKFFLK